ncbi:hypothetical protein RE628_11315 [Paenibacillus sp. D2_2]|uniref:hypothetical protein n=1 Tax=Paenibacillus sp. D2_2 TaxID=3073092 RepID=UPI00281645A7|nr:hypothetical protein [Paenibacillus sp. D2_2]WMT42816.1 hypothetical protein RE628_11315 [Paenibacillus sp. D2_2]
MYDYDFYNEPNEFEQQVDEFKESLMNSVRDDYKAKMDKLRKENAELQEVKKNFEAIKRDFNQKVLELDMQKRTLKNDVRRERLLELMGDFKVELFRVNYDWKSGPKCDKCDEARNIYYKSPLGNQKVEQCDCKNNIKYYYPRPHICSSFELRNGKFVAWYKPYCEADGMEFETIGSSSVPRFIYKGEDFELIKEEHYYVYFETQEQCQAYCDWLTVKEDNQ